MECITIHSGISLQGLELFLSTLPRFQKGIHLQFWDLVVPNNAFDSLATIKSLSIGATRNPPSGRLPPGQLDAIGGLPNLRVLSFWGYAVNDNDLATLAVCKSLRRVKVRTLRSQNPSRELESASPDCEVILELDKQTRGSVRGQARCGIEIATCWTMGLNGGESAIIHAFCLTASVLASRCKHVRRIVAPCRSRRRGSHAVMDCFQLCWRASSHAYWHMSLG